MPDHPEVFTPCEQLANEYLSALREWVSVYRLESGDFDPIESEAQDNGRGDDRADERVVMGGSRG